ncbi:unnamed protein product [Rotaria magnacalcarata]
MVTSNANDSSIIARIYSNLVEVIRPLRQELPLEFSANEWSFMRTDSITLLNANITSQTVVEKKKLLDNIPIYVRWPPSHGIDLKEAKLVDEERRLVKIHPENKTEFVYYILPENEPIMYVNEYPSGSRFYVDFTYKNMQADQPVYVSYLSTNLKWKVNYQLMLENEDANLSLLIAVADIRNDAPSAMSLEQVELFAGDINIKVPSSSLMLRHGFTELASAMTTSNPNMFDSENENFVFEYAELNGIYAYKIDKPFYIGGMTNYILSMFHDRINIEQYVKVSISSYGVSALKGKGERSYRLKSSNRFLPQGTCVVRHSKRIIGETQLSNIAVNQWYEFTLGDDPDIVYQQYSTLLSTTLDKDKVECMKSQRRSVYVIEIRLSNFKKSSVDVEYSYNVNGYALIRLLPSQASLLNVNESQSLFQQKDSAIKANIKLAANELQTFSYEIEVVKNE